MKFTVATDEDLNELTGMLRAEVIEAIREATDEPGTNPTVPVRIDVETEIEAEPIAEPPEGSNVAGGHAGP